MKEQTRRARIFKPTFDQLVARCSVIPDAPDRRDWVVEAGHPGVTSLPDSLPTSVDLSAQTPEVEDQGDYGSCVGWAVVRGLREWMFRKVTGRDVRLSVRFVWMAAKETDQFEINTFVANAGTSLKTAFQVLKKYGVPEEKYYPYNRDLVLFTSLQQKHDFFFSAARFRIYNYYMLANNDARKLHLVKVGPFVVTVPVDNLWLGVGADGVIPDQSGDNVAGGHAVLVVGYDDRTQRFKFKNSWGKAWGNRGFGYFSYQYAESKIWTAMGTDLIPESTN